MTEYAGIPVTGRWINIVHLELIMVAMAKRMLLDPRVKAGDRLRMLEYIHGYVRPGGLTAEQLELFDPTSDAEEEMIAEARSLDPKPWPAGNYGMPASFDVLCDSFEHFAKLNAGIRAAVATCAIIAAPRRPLCQSRPVSDRIISRRPQRCKSRVGSATSRGIDHDAPRALSGGDYLACRHRDRRLGDVGRIHRDGARSSEA
jgi:hypothetical protein